jgi:TRAP-type C4-dicarboxylate transport system substrate-binding protein
METREKILQVFLVLVLCALTLVFAQPAKAAPVTLKAVTFLPFNHPNVDPWVKMMVDRVNKESKGELTIKWLGGPEVIGSYDQTNALKTGVVDMLPYHPFGYMAPVMKEGNAGGLTQLAGWEERNSGAFDLWDTIFQKRVNAKYLGRSHTGPGLPFWVYTNFKVEKIEDFKGKILRVMPLYIPWLKAMGASTVTTPPGEIYTSIERKVIDGFVYPFGIVSWGLQEVTKYRVEPGVFTMEAACMVNLDTWKKIPKHLQNILLDVMEDFEYIGYAQQVVRVELERETMIKAGMTMISLPPSEAKKFRDLAYNITWEQVIKDCPEYGPKLREMTTRK